MTSIIRGDRMKQQLLLRPTTNTQRTILVARMKHWLLETSMVLAGYEE